MFKTSIYRHTRTIRVWLFLTLLAGMLSWTKTAHAATIEIGPGDVAGLIKAITVANATPSGVTTIGLASNATYTLTAIDYTRSAIAGDPLKPGAKVGPNGLPIITSNIVIMGRGAILQRSGSPAFRIMEVFSGARLTLNDLTLQGGNPGTAKEGGAVLVGINANVTLNDTVLTQNQADFGGAISNHGKLVINQSRIEHNTAGQGGGIYNGNSGNLSLKESLVTSNSATAVGGGIYSKNATAVISNSHLDGNLAPQGGGIWNDDSSLLTLQQQTVIGANYATAKGGSLGVPVGGGGIANHDGRVSGKDVVLINNKAEFAGGGILNTYGTVQLDTSLIVDNSSAIGAGIFTIDLKGPTSKDRAVMVSGSCISENQSLVLPTVTVEPAIIYNADFASTMTAKQNWWGQASGPLPAGSGPQSTVSTNVEYAPFLGQAPGFCNQAAPEPIAAAPGLELVAAVSESGCTDLEGLQINLPEGTHLHYICSFDAGAGAVTIAATDADDNLVDQFPAPVEVCFTGQVQLYAQSIDGSGEPQPLQAQNKTDSSCAALQRPAIVSANP